MHLTHRIILNCAIMLYKMLNKHVSAHVKVNHHAMKA